MVQFVTFKKGTVSYPGMR